MFLSICFVITLRSAKSQNWSSEDLQSIQETNTDSLRENEVTARALDGVPEAARTRWLRELVVETFSTYIMGPAYACASPLTLWDLPMPVR